MYFYMQNTNYRILHCTKSAWQQQELDMFLIHKMRQSHYKDSVSMRMRSFHSHGVKLVKIHRQFSETFGDGVMGVKNMSSCSCDSLRNAEGPVLLL